MKWVVAAIVVFVAGYTGVNLWFRKPGRPHQPAQEMRDRATAARLQEAGWERGRLETHRPADNEAPAGGAEIRRGAVGFGLDLDACFIEKPRLASSIDRVVAPAVVAAGTDYPVRFTASIQDQYYQVADVMLLRRGEEFVLAPVVEPLPGKNLLSRWPDSTHVVTLPPGLAPGRYRVRVIANGPAALWHFEVR